MLLASDPQAQAPQMPVLDTMTSKAPTATKAEANSPSLLCHAFRVLRPVRESPACSLTHLGEGPKLHRSVLAFESLLGPRTPPWESRRLYTGPGSRLVLDTGRAKVFIELWPLARVEVLAGRCGTALGLLCSEMFGLQVCKRCAAGNFQKESPASPGAQTPPFIPF